MTASTVPVKIQSMIACDVVERTQSSGPGFAEHVDWDSVLWRTACEHDVEHKACLEQGIYRGRDGEQTFLPWFLDEAEEEEGHGPFGDDQANEVDYDLRSSELPKCNYRTTQGYERARRRTMVKSFRLLTTSKSSSI